MIWPFVEHGPRQGAPVLLLHGMPGSKADLAPLAEQLAQRHRVVCPDFPGFGENPAPPRGDASPSGCARALLSFADSLGLARFGLVAHSMGGAMALTLAAEHPQRINSLVLLASVGLRPHAAFTVSPSLLRALLPVVRSFSLASRLAQRALSAAYQRQGLQRSSELDAAQALWHLELFGAVRFAALRRAAMRVSCPTLVVNAADDRLVASSIGDELCSAIPGARRLLLAAGGHRLPQRHATTLAGPVVLALARGQSVGEPTWN
jgi:pimeloyl-ACP methyl ester carboxylesterase